MGCCFFAVIGAIWPRLILAYIYFAAYAIPAKAFKTSLWPLLGFFFLPTTTLAYELCLFYIGPIENPWSLALVVLALLHDLGQFGIFRKRRTSAE